jgi:hypothetical protein
LVVLDLSSPSGAAPPGRLPQLDVFLRGGDERHLLLRTPRSPTTRARTASSSGMIVRSIS